MFVFPSLKNVITDTHLDRGEGRFGRLVTFLARLGARGVGVSEKAAVCIDKHGIGRLTQIQEHVGAAYFVEAPGAQLVEGAPLPPTEARVCALTDPRQRFDFHAWQGTGESYHVTVSGDPKLPSPYSIDPYRGAAPKPSR